jgi:hypothetical protein
MSFWKKFISFITPPSKKVEKVVKPKVIKKTPVVKPKRAKTKKGKFIADDKSTLDVNEAWVGGKAPAKKKGRLTGSKKKK